MSGLCWKPGSQNKLYREREEERERENRVQNPILTIFLYSVTRETTAANLPTLTRVYSARFNDSDTKPSLINLMNVNVIYYKYTENQEAVLYLFAFEQEKNFHFLTRNVLYTIKPSRLMSRQICIIGNGNVGDNFSFVRNCLSFY